MSEARETSEDGPLGLSSKHKVAIVNFAVCYPHALARPVYLHVRRDEADNHASADIHVRKSCRPGYHRSIMSRSYGGWADHASHVCPLWYVYFLIEVIGKSVHD